MSVVSGIAAYSMDFGQPAIFELLETDNGQLRTGSRVRGIPYRLLTLTPATSNDRS
jgi:hypothetical protein